MSDLFQFRSRPARTQAALTLRRHGRMGWQTRLRRAWALAFSRDGAAGLLVAALVGALLLAGYRMQSAEQAGAEQEHVQRAVDLAASVVQADLSRSLAAADTLEAMLRQSGTVEPFELAVSELRQRFPLIHTVTLAPGGVVKRVSPSELAATFTGMRLLDVPASRTEARLALRTRSMVVGVANVGRQEAYITGYQPIYKRSNAGADGAPSTSLWGFVTVTLKLPALDPYLASARMRPGDWLAELMFMDEGGSGWMRLSDDTMGAQQPVASAVVNLPGRKLQLRISPRPSWHPVDAWPAALVVLALLAGVTCTLVLNRRRRLALRRQFFETSQILAGWTEEFDAAHAQLDLLRRTHGMAVVALVRMPLVGTFQRQGSPVAAGEQRDWSAQILNLQRGGDLLLHLHGNDFLLAAHSLPTQELAVRVRRRLQAELQSLCEMACGPDCQLPFFDAVVFDPDARNPGVVLAKLLVTLHAPEHRQRRQRPVAGLDGSRLANLR